MITAYVGLLGGGKTYSLIHAAVSRFRRTHCQVYTDIATLKLPEAVYISADEPTMLAEVADGLLLLDEAQVTCDARYWQKVPSVFLHMLTQGRKNGIELWYTTQLFEQVDARLRGITNQMIYCRKVGPVIVQERRVPGKTEVLGRSVVRFDGRIAWFYDSWEVVGRRVGANAPRSAALAAVRGPSGPRAAAEWPATGAYWVGRELRLSRAGRSCLDWMRACGRPLGPDWVGDVRYELRRRAWLRYLRLAPESVPVECTPDAPWLRGWSPTDAEARRLAREHAERMEEAASRAGSRSASSVRAK